MKIRRDVQRKNIVNNVDRPGLGTPWQIAKSNDDRYK